VKRTTIFLSDEVHARLRRDAFRAKVSMAELIRIKLDAPARRAKSRARREDPILKVAGICQSGPRPSEDIDQALYGG
jgi:hypothetical protein